MEFDIEAGGAQVGDIEVSPPRLIPLTQACLYVVLCAEHQRTSAMARGRSLSEVQREFPDEARCAAFLFVQREQKIVKAEKWVVIEPGKKS